jgi:hypothetical protein
VQQTSMPPQDTANFNDSIAIAIFFGGCVFASDVWAVHRQGRINKRGRGRDRGGVVEQDSLFLLWTREKEENPYSQARLGKGYDKAQEQSYDDPKTTQQRQYYWRVTPMSSQSRTIDSRLYNSMDENGEDDYVGACTRVGIVLERVLRTMQNSNWRTIAENAIYPCDESAQYLQAYAKLPMLLIELGR